MSISSPGRAAVAPPPRLAIAHQHARRRARGIGRDDEVRRPPLQPARDDRIGRQRLLGADVDAFREAAVARAAEFDHVDARPRDGDLGVVDVVSELALAVQIDVDVLGRRSERERPRRDRLGRRRGASAAGARRDARQSGSVRAARRGAPGRARRARSAARSGGCWAAGGAGGADSDVGAAVASATADDGGGSGRCLVAARATSRRTRRRPRAARPRRRSRVSLLAAAARPSSRRSAPATTGFSGSKASTRFQQLQRLGRAASPPGAAAAASVSAAASRLGSAAS